MDPVPTTDLRELLRQQRFAELLATAQSLLSGHPGHRDALLFSAIAQRMLNRLPEALATLSELERHHPAFSRLYEERGRCFVAQRQAR